MEVAIHLDIEREGGSHGMHKPSDLDQRNEVHLAMTWGGGVPLGLPPVVSNPCLREGGSNVTIRGHFARHSRGRGGPFGHSPVLFALPKQHFDHLCLQFVLQIVLFPWESVGFLKAMYLDKIDPKLHFFGPFL